MAARSVPAFPPGQHRLETQLGKADAAKCFAIAEEAKRLITERIAKHQIDCDLKWGYLHVVAKPSQFDHLREWKEELDALGYTGTEILTKAAVDEKLGTNIYHGGLRESGAGHFHPLNYCLGLAARPSRPAQRSTRIRPSFQLIPAPSRRPAPRMAAFAPKPW